MSLSNQTSNFITASGVFGGVGKALFNQQIMANITFQGVCDVAVYAAISAVVAYVVKVSIDLLKKWLRK